MEQLLVHGLADFFLTQGTYQALNKSKRTAPALLHAALYTACFLLLTRSFWALFVIGFTHFLIDRFSLPKYLIFAKERAFNPKSWHRPWKNCNLTGYFDQPTADFNAACPDCRPLHLTIFLYIVTDNLFHLTINYLALRLL